MYPNTYRPYSGIFVEEQVHALKKIIDGNITVISPVPWAPRFLWFRKKWREYGQIEKEIIKNGIKVFYPRYFVIPGKIFFPLEGFFIYFSVRSLINKLIKVNKSSNILHTHTILPDGLAGVLLKKKLKIPHICTIHGSDINIYPFRNRFTHYMTRYALKKVDHLITVSNKLKAKVNEMVGIVNNISVIYNGADAEKFKPISKEIAKGKLNINETNRVILFVGNLIPVKGVNFLIESFARLQREYKKNDIVLYLIGDGIEKETFISMVKRLNIEKDVFFKGKRPHNEIPLWLNIADIFVLPSISEGFPTVIPEAMMCGVPIVATDVGGISEAIIDNENGLLIESKSVEELTKAINTFLNNDQFKLKVIEAGKRYSTDFTWEKNAEKTIKLYEEVLSGSGQ